MDVSTLPPVSLHDVNAELARRTLIDFTTFTFAKYKTEWFHEYVANELDKVIDEDGARVMIFMPPQHGKSELVSRRFPAQVLGKKPDWNIILGSYNHTFAAKFSRAIKRTMRSESYQELYPNTKLDGVGCPAGTYEDKAHSFDVHNGKEKLGSFMSVGVGTGATGNPCDLLILDDVIKDRQEADSKAYRDKLWDWWTEALQTRLHDKSKIIITFTRWHEDDLAGRILADDPGRWKIIMLPAIKEDNSNPDDIRLIGQALYPSKHGLQKLLKIKDSNPRTFSSLYQQRPSPLEGALIKREYFEVITPSQAVSMMAGREIIKHMVVDTAFTTQSKNDPCACLTFFIVDNILVIVDFWKDRLEMPDLISKLSAHNGRYAHAKKSIMFIEPKANGISAVQTLKRIRDTQGRLMNVREDFSPVTDKEARVNGILDILMTGRVMLVVGHWNNLLLSDWALFPNGKDKEAADVLVQAVDKLEHPEKLNAIVKMRVTL
jgi:predicted phage terminase large subunit-like protein